MLIKRQYTEINTIKSVINIVKKLGICVIIVVIVGYCGGIVKQTANWLIRSPIAFLEGTDIAKIDFEFLSCIREGLGTKSGIVMSGILLVIVAILYIKKIRPRLPKKKRGILDEDRNFKYSETGTYGTSQWISREELEKVAEVKPLEKTNGDILGYFRNTQDIVSLPTKEEFDKKTDGWTVEDKNDIRLNSHKAVFGASGTMKSRALARNLFLQAVRRGESIICTDPSGELYKDMSEYARGEGYEVRMLNLVDQNSSDSWNMLQSVANSLDADTTAEIFVATIMENAKGARADYWGDNAKNLLKALCLFVAQSPTLPSTMPQVYDILTMSTPAMLDAYFDEINDNTAAKRAYNIFKTCTNDVKGQIKNGLGILLNVFQNSSLRNITSYDEIEIEKMGKEKCAYFIITSDQHSTFDFIAVVFYTMLFIRLAELAQKQNNIDGRLTIPINMILDEFPNIGQIPDFTKKISTVRKYGISITVIFQNIAQLMNRYPMGQWEEILGNCDTKIFLGCTDLTTADYISACTGIASIEVETGNTTIDKEYIFLPQDPKLRTSEGIGKRNLMNSDEIQRLRNSTEILMLRGQKPLLVDKFDYTKHPESKKFVKVEITDYVPQWREKKEQIAEQDKEYVAACEKKGQTTPTQVTGSPIIQDKSNGEAIPVKVTDSIFDFE